MRLVWKSNMIHAMDAGFEWKEYASMDSEGRACGVCRCVYGKRERERDVCVREREREWEEVSVSQSQSLFDELS
jgi:hypothetical protein